ncbi:MAG: hypothetical protein ACREBU_01485 [Nitrososphaera sp.]
MNTQSLKSYHIKRVYDKINLMLNDEVTYFITPKHGLLIALKIIQTLNIDDEFNEIVKIMSEQKQ